MKAKRKQERAQENAAHHYERTQLPSLMQLWQESWELFAKTVGSYTKLIGVVFLILIFGAMLGLLFGLSIAFSSFNVPFQMLFHPTPFRIATWMLLLIWFIAYVITLILISLFFPIASIVVLREKRIISLRNLLTRAKGFVLPYLLTGLLVSFIVIGGYTLFIVPGILFSVLFLFWMYEVVLEKQSGKSAIAASYLLVKNYFWETLIRVLILNIGIMLLSGILTRLAKDSAIVMIASIIFSLLAGWFAQVYLYTLYMQIKETALSNKTISFRWIWIISVLGWAFFLVGVTFVFWIIITYFVSGTHTTPPTHPIV